MCKYKHTILQKESSGNVMDYQRRTKVREKVGNMRKKRDSHSSFCIFLFFHSDYFYLFPFVHRGYLSTKTKNHIWFSYFNFSILKISLRRVTLNFDFKKSDNLNLGKLTHSKILTGHYTCQTCHEE